MALIKSRHSAQINSDTAVLGLYFNGLENISSEDYYYERVKELKSGIFKNDMIIHGIDSIEKRLGEKSKTAVAYNYSFRFRAKNGFGARMLYEYILQVRKHNLEIFNIATEADEISLDFGDFPGYANFLGQEDAIKQRAESKASKYVDSLKTAKIRNKPIIQSSNSYSEDDKVYMVVEQQAEYEGGLQAMAKFIGANLNVPSDIYGSVFISFVIGKDGGITDVQIVKGMDAKCDAEAVRVVSMMPPWKPARQNGKIVRSRFVLPIKFKSEE
jgi:TonB family protein